MQYGQKQYHGAGLPVILEEASATFLNLRLPRFGSITGIVADENDVGILEHDVVAYCNTRPPQIAGRARTDDRGVYRIWGLEPGAYLVRALAKQHEETATCPPSPAKPPAPAMPASTKSPSTSKLPMPTCGPYPAA